MGRKEFQMENKNKMVAFIIMLIVLFIGTGLSLGLYVNEKTEAMYSEIISLDETVKRFLNVNEKLLLEGEEDLVVEGVLTELESIMTYDDELAFKEVVADKGQVVLCSYGCSEIILVSGEAEVYCEGDIGFIDITNGNELLDGDKIDENHLFVMPVPDVNGATVTSDEATFLIRGGYAIKE